MVSKHGNAAAHEARGGSEVDLLDAINSDNKPLSHQLQVCRLVTRFGLTQPIADVVAGLHYGAVSA